MKTTGILILLIFAICSTTVLAQSEYLRPGQSAFFFDAGYASSEGEGSFGGSVGFSTAGRADFGLGLAYTRSYTTANESARVHLLRVHHERDNTFVVTLDESYTFWDNSNTYPEEVVRVWTLGLHGGLVVKPTDNAFSFTMGGSRVMSSADYIEAINTFDLGVGFAHYFRSGLIAFDLAVSAGKDVTAVGLTVGLAFNLRSSRRAYIED
jgi:hypothetical protein